MLLRRREGKPTTEQTAIRLAMRPLVRLYGETIAREFAPLALKAVRDSMITESWMNAEETAKHRKANRKIGWSRKTVNDHVARIKLAFRWATENELIPASVYQALKTVTGMRRGRSGARENDPVKPIDPEIVEAVIPHLPPVVADNQPRSPRSVLHGADTSH